MGLKIFIRRFKPFWYPIYLLHGVSFNCLKPLSEEQPQYPQAIWRILSTTTPMMIRRWEYHSRELPLFVKTSSTRIVNDPPFVRG